MFSFVFLFYFTFHIIFLLFQIAWLLNIRGSDVKYNPVSVSYVVVTLEETHLFINPNKVSNPLLTAHLSKGGVTVHPYGEVENYLKSLVMQKQVVLVDPAQVNWRLFQAVDGFSIETISPIALKKSVKNSAELAGVRQAHIRDGAALTAFLCWLEDAVKNRGFAMTEYDAVVKLEEFRQKAAHHCGPSFDTIAGFASNGYA